MILQGVDVGVIPDADPESRATASEASGRKHHLGRLYRFPKIIDREADTA